MSLKYICVFVLSLILAGLLIGNLRTEKAVASGTIYILANGSISPSWVNITNVDNRTYMFTGVVNDSIVVQRDNIVIDGAGYLLNGTGSGSANGISLSYRTNVTIVNVRIENFYDGVYFYDCSLCNISANTFTRNRWHAIEIYDSSNCTLQGNNITDNTNRAIYLRYSSYNTIVGNEIGGNHRGIEIDSLSDYNIILGNNITNNDNEGIFADYSKFNSIIENNVTENRGRGIAIGQCSNVTVAYNKLENNTDSGLAVAQSPNGTIIGNEVSGNGFGIEIMYLSGMLMRNNTMTDNTWNFELGFINASDFVNDVDESNTVNGKPIYYWVEEHDRVVPEDAGAVILFNCTGVFAQNLNISDGARQGAIIACSTNTTIADSRIHTDAYCVWLWNSTDCHVISSYLDGFMSFQLSYSANNTIYGNTVINGGNWGSVNIAMSSGNTFYRNNFTNNYNDVVISDDSVNNWDNGYPDGGNYWDHYTVRFPYGQDVYGGPFQNETGSDGFWDVAYELNENNTDHYPIVPEYTSTLLAVAFMTITLVAAVALRGRNRTRPRYVNRLA